MIHGLPIERLRYSRRNAILEFLGFGSYREYLNSPLWQEVRQKVLVGGPCYVCGRLNATQVHHQEYTEENLCGDSLQGMVPICGGCHRKVEFSPSGKKYSMIGANRKTDSLRGSRMAAERKPPRRKGKKKFKRCKRQRFKALFS